MPPSPVDSTFIASKLHTESEPNVPHARGPTREATAQAVSSTNGTPRLSQSSAMRAMSPGPPP